MTALEAMAALDELRHNDFPRERKLAWLSELDWAAKLLVLDTHEAPAPAAPGICQPPGAAPGSTVPFSGYGPDTPGDTRLLIPEPFCAVYLHWLTAQVCYHQSEWEDYNAATARFNEAWQRFSAHHTRTHRPLARQSRFRF